MPRPRLAAALDAAVRSRLTVVFGGPGWGKTTAVATWAADRGACWAGLDGEHTPTAVMRCLLAGLGQQLPDLPAELMLTGRAGAGSVAQVRANLAGALGRLLTSRLGGGPDPPLVLVVDAGSGAAGAAAALLDELTRQAPAALRLVLLSEHPATELLPDRIGPLSTIGPEQLAFTTAEIAALLSAVHPCPGEAPTALQPEQPDPAAQPTGSTGNRPPVAQSAETTADQPLAAQQTDTTADLPLAAQQTEITGVWPLAAKLAEVTGGWPLAVKLAVTEVGGDPRECVDPARLSDGGILRPLAEAAVRREPPPARELLRIAAELGPVDAALLTTIGAPAAPDLLPGLAARGLLRPDGTDWSVIPPVRELLAGADPDTVLHARAADHYVHSGQYEAGLRHLVAAGDRAGATRLLVEHGDAMLDGGAVDAVLAAAHTLELAGTDPDLPIVLGYARELQGDWLGALSAYRTAAAGTGPLPPLVAMRYGQMCYLAGELDEAIRTFHRATGTDPPGPHEIRLQCRAANWLRAAGDEDGAHRVAAAAAAAAERTGDQAGAARSHWALATLAAHGGDRVGHDSHHRRAMRLAEQLGEHRLRLGLSINHASYLAEEGPPAEALAEAEYARGLGEQVGMIGHEPICQNIRARALARLGRFDEALSLVDASQLRSGDTGPTFDVAFGLIVRADVHCRRGEPGQAQAALAESLQAIGQAAEMRPMYALGLSTLARAQAEDLPAAAKTADEAIIVATGTGRVPALLARGWVALLAGDRDRAARDAAEARTVAGARRDHGGVAEALELTVLSAAEPPAAVGLLDEAAALWATLGDPVGLARVRLVRARLAGPAAAAAVTAAQVDLQRLGVRTQGLVAGAIAVPAGRPPITVRTLGTFRVTRQDIGIQAGEWKSKQARDLFKILVSQRGRPVTREWLVSLLWPDEVDAERTANRLSVLLTRLRTVLDPDRQLPDPGPILADRETVALDLDLVELDLVAFLEIARAARQADRQGSDDTAALLAAADASCGGDYLPDDPYADWSGPVRDEIRDTHAAVLRLLVPHSTDPDEIEQHLLRLLAYQPYDEQAHLRLVAVLDRAGRHGEARRRYAAYVERMTELGVPPTAPPWPE